MTGQALRIRNLCRSFGQRKALAGISFDLPAGAFLTIFGHNGAGKTTLLRLLATLDKPSSGSIEALGIDAKEEPQRLRGRIGFLSHQPLLYAEMTAEENLRLTAKLYGVADEESRISQMLASTGLASRRLDVVGTFSRGMLQRLSLARCLLHDPELVFLDEPFTGLDPQGAQTLLEIIAANRSRRSFVMVSHDPAAGASLATHILVLERGRMLSFGSRDEFDPGILSGAAGALSGAAAGAAASGVLSGAAGARGAR